MGGGVKKSRMIRGFRNIKEGSIEIYKVRIGGENMGEKESNKEGRGEYKERVNRHNIL